MLLRWRRDRTVRTHTGLFPEGYRNLQTLSPDLFRLERRATTKNNENHSVCDRFPIAYFLPSLERRATTKNNENHSVCDRFSIAYFLLERPYPYWVSY
jgi:hypothetical protein